MGILSLFRVHRSIYNGMERDIFPDVGIAACRILPARFHTMTTLMCQCVNYPASKP